MNEYLTLFSEEFAKHKAEKLLQDTARRKRRTVEISDGARKGRAKVLFFSWDNTGLHHGFYYSGTVKQTGALRELPRFLTCAQRSLFLKNAQAIATTECIIIPKCKFLHYINTTNNVM